jgi:putative protease
MDQGLKQLTVSYDLNITEVLALLRYEPSAAFELTIHQHMPMFHMEHCVFAAFLSDGTNYTNCGRPCDLHTVKLRDRVGSDHLLKADVGCRNTLFNARAQTGAQFIRPLTDAGLRRFRLEFLSENSDEARRMIRIYRHLLGGEIPGEELWRALQIQFQLGVTKGSLGKQYELRSKGSRARISTYEVRKLNSIRPNSYFWLLTRCLRLAQYGPQFLLNDHFVRL